MTDRSRSAQATRKPTTKTEKRRPAGIPDHPTDGELHEIVRRLWALAGTELSEPVSASSVWRTLEYIKLMLVQNIEAKRPSDERTRLGATHGALAACADELGWRETHNVIRELHHAVGAYASWLREGTRRRATLRTALEQASPLLAAEATRRVDSLASLNARMREMGEARGYVLDGPPPDALRELPEAIADLLDELLPHTTDVQTLRQYIRDLSLVTPHDGVDIELAPVKTRIALSLRSGGFTVPEITRVTEPFAKPGAQWTAARDRIRKRLKTGARDKLSPDDGGTGG